MGTGGRGEEERGGGGEGEMGDEREKWARGRERWGGALVWPKHDGVQF